MALTACGGGGDDGGSDPSSISSQSGSSANANASKDSGSAASDHRKASPDQAGASAHSGSSSSADADSGDLGGAGQADTAHGRSHTSRGSGADAGADQDTSAQASAEDTTTDSGAGDTAEDTTADSGADATAEDTTADSGADATAEDTTTDSGADATATDDTAASTAQDQTQPAREIVSFEAISRQDTTQQDVPVTLGQVFRKGDVTDPAVLTASMDGQSLPLQVDQKATWPDGSLRHAVLTVRLPNLDGGGDSEVTLADGGGADSKPAVTADQLLATNFDATAKIEIGGQTYTSSARTLLQQAVQRDNCSAQGKACRRWLSGPLVSEWIVGGRLGTTGAAQHLTVYFNVRAYAAADGGVTRARVDTVIENDWAYTPNPANRTYNATLSVGDQQYNVDGLTHYRQARWHRRLWWGKKAGVYARLNSQYLQSSRAISRYAEVTPGEDLLSSVSRSFPPMDHGDQTPNMGNTGAQASIGPLPRWTSTYVVSTDERAYDWMLANDDAVGSYGFHYRDDATGRPVTITDHPYITIANIRYARGAGSNYQDDLLPSCPDNCGSPYTFDISHHPSIGYVPYLVTGDFYYLEEMQFAASYVELWANPAYRDYEYGKLIHAQSQVRGQAWGMRAIADAAFATPDADPLKAYFTTMIEHVVAAYNDLYVSNPDEHPLHALDKFGAVVYTFGSERAGIAPWQEHFFTWSAGHARDLGFKGAKRLSKWLAVFPIEQMTNWTADIDGGYCWLQASGYQLRIRDSGSDSDPEYQSLDRAYQETFPELVGLDCNSQEMVNKLSEGGQSFQRGQMQGYAGSPTGFPANLQIGLAMAADSGIDNARKAWDIFAGRSVKPDYRNYPNFAVVPRK